MDPNRLIFSFGDVPADGGDTDTGVNRKMRKFVEGHAKGVEIHYSIANRVETRAKNGWKRIGLRFFPWKLYAD